MRELNKFERAELQRLKEGTKFHDLSSQDIDFLIKARGFPQEERDAISDRLTKAFIKDGSQKLMRAFLEGIMTEQEWLDWKGKGLDETDFSTMLGAFFAKRDKYTHDDEVVHIVTNRGSNIWKHRVKLGKRFGVHIISEEEAVLMTAEKENGGENDGTDNNRG